MDNVDIAVAAWTYGKIVPKSRNIDEEEQQ